MLEELYKKSIEKRQEIEEHFEKLGESLDKEKARQHYNEHNFTKTERDKTFAAIDGSFNKENYLSTFIFALESQTIISKAHENQIIKHSSAADISHISTIESTRIDSIISTYMNILELKSTIDTLKRHDIDYMLLDGSILGTLRNIKYYHLPENIKRILMKLSLDIMKELGEDEIKIYVSSIEKKALISKLIDDELDENSENINQIRKDAQRFYAQLEQLTCIAYLLENYSDRIVCVSKTSSTTSVFKERIPDMAVIEYLFPESGYTNLEPAINILAKSDEQGTIYRKYPVYHSQLSGKKFTIFYVRFEYNSDVLKIELPIELNDEMKALEILEDISTSCVEGYPFILRKAHEEVLIKNKDIKRIIANYDIPEKPSRNMLKKK